MIFDLHTHTNFSDGLYSTRDLIDLAIEKKLNGIAITDHDTVQAIEYIHNYKTENNFHIIPGIEFSTVNNNEEVHILGYFLDINNDELIDITNKLKNSRIERGIKMINNLNKLGLKINIDEVKDFSSDKYIGRPHIARVLVEKEYCSSMEEAFDKYLNRGAPGYAERYKMEIIDTIDLIKNSEGISVLAHPGILKDKSIISYCIKHGIQGIECIHPKHNKSATKELINLSEEYNLMITGGSDFHGDSLDDFGKYFVDINKIPEFKERLK